jgi:putative chitinase
LRLSPNFILAEFIRSDEARKLGDPNQPTPAHLANLKITAAGMEKVREICGGRPITIHSGYRNPAVNRAVGGVTNSDHALGLAADFTVAGLTPIAAARLIRDSRLVFDQLILESGRGVVHIGFNPRARRDVRTQKGAPGTPTQPGLVR